MSRVILLKPAAAIEAAPVEHSNFIEDAYAKLEALPGFVVRDQQIELSRQVLQAFTQGTPLLAEAPTGTGKTLAYLIGALAAQEKVRPEGKTLPVVISTATKGLQQQVLSGDLPLLERAGVVAPGTSALAKGRGNYLCERAARAYANQEDDSQLDLLEETQASTPKLGYVQGVRDLLTQFDTQGWDGDLASLKGRRPSAWPEVNAQASPCLGRSCNSYDTCGFIKARAKVGVAEIIVANHDLVLRDLLMVKDGMDGLLPKRYFLVFDEGHHVPDKAIDAARVELRLDELADNLKAYLPHAGGLWKGKLLARLSAKLNAKGLAPELFRSGEVAAAIASLRRVMEDMPGFDEQGTLRFPKGQVPAALLECATKVRAELGVLSTATEDATDIVRTTLSTNAAGAGEDLVAALTALNRISGVLGAATRAMAMFCSPERFVRWAVCQDESRAELHASPLDARDTLQNLLWSNTERVTPAFVSATLRDLNGFARFRDKTAMPAAALEFVLQSHFPYAENHLLIAETSASARANEREAFTAELKKLVPQYLLARTGNLVLFQSDRLMKEVAIAVKKEFAGKVLVQGELAFRDLIEQHKQAVDAGKGSVLMGVATMAEGLDLPGAYCTNLVLTQLPFAVPTSPVEQELAEELGPRYFKERSLPDAFVRLMQMVGRLMRKESDRGRIVVLDKRLYQSPWGRQMLQALPPFRKRIAKPEDLAPALRAVA